MANLNNALVLRFNTASGLTGNGQNDNVLGYGPNQSSTVIPNKRHETVQLLKDFLDQLQQGDTANASMRADVGGVAAAGTFTVATGSGTITAVINGVSIAKTATGVDATDAAAMAAAINASTNALVAPLVSATSALGVVTVTAKGSAFGVSGNAITTTATGTGFTAQQARLTGGLDVFPAVSAATASGTLTISSGSGAITAINANTLCNGRVVATSGGSGVVTVSASSPGSWGNTITFGASGTGATVTNTTAGNLAGGADATLGYAEVTQTQASQTDTISGSDSGAYTVVINGSTVTATGTSNDTTTAAAIATAILASTAVGVAGRVTATSALGVVTVTALPNSVYDGTAGNSVTFTATGTGATAGNTTLLGGLNGVTCRWTY